MAQARLHAGLAGRPRRARPRHRARRSAGQSVDDPARSRRHAQRLRAVGGRAGAGIVLLAGEGRHGAGSGPPPGDPGIHQPGLRAVPLPRHGAAGRLPESRIRQVCARPQARLHRRGAPDAVRSRPLRRCHPQHLCRRAAACLGVLSGPGADRREPPEERRLAAQGGALRRAGAGVLAEGDHLRLQAALGNASIALCRGLAVADVQVEDHQPAILDAKLERGAARGRTAIAVAALPQRRGGGELGIVREDALPRAPAPGQALGEIEQPALGVDLAELLAVHEIERARVEGAGAVHRARHIEQLSRRRLHHDGRLEMHAIDSGGDDGREGGAAAAKHHHAAAAAILRIGIALELEGKGIARACDVGEGLDRTGIFRRIGYCQAGLARLGIA